MQPLPHSIVYHCCNTECELNQKLFFFFSFVTFLPMTKLLHEPSFSSLWAPDGKWIDRGTRLSTITFRWLLPGADLVGKFHDQVSFL